MPGGQEGRLRQISADGAGNPCRQGGKLGYGQWQRRDVGGRDTSEPDERYGADYRTLDLGDRRAGDSAKVPARNTAETRR